MKATSTFRATFIAITLAIGLSGCSDNQEEMSQEEIEYISHVDQSRFFQRQGELRSSTQEARSAIELQPGRPDPYFIILNNLLTAGDAVNAERQLGYLLDSIPEESKTEAVESQAALLRAEANLMQGQLEDALDALKSLESLDRVQTQKAEIIKGRTLLAAGRPDDAQKAFEEAHAISESVEAMVGLSRTAMQRGQREQAQEYISQAEEIDQNASELWLWKAQLAEQAENWSDAEEAYIRALEEIGRYDIMTYRKYETMSALIRALREQGKSSEAFVYEEILAKSAPGTIKSNLQAAQSAYEEGNLDEAARFLEEIRAQAPGNEQAATMLGLVRFRQGRVEEAEQLLAPVAELGDSELASKLVAASRLQLRDPQGAKKVLENLKSADTDPSVLAMVGIASLSTGDLDTGEALLEKSLSLNPDNQNLRIRYTRYLLSREKTDKAFEQLDLLSEQQPDSPLVKSLRVQAHLVAGEREKAIDVANQWLSESPDDLTANMTRGEIAAQAGNYEEAARSFEKATALDSTNPAPKVALGRMALAQDDQEAAKQQFIDAANLSPNNMQALQGMAATHTADELKPEMEKLIQDHPASIAPRLILLEIALTSGDQTRADELAATLLERDAENNPAPAESAVANIFNGVGAKLRRSGDLERADNVLERGRVLFPENENIALQSASLAFSQKQEDKARRILQEVKQAHDQSPGPYVVEAQYFASLEQYQEAVEMYELAIEKGAGPDTKLALVRSMERSGQTDKAIQLAKEFLGQHPEHQGLLMSSAMLHQQKGEASEAINAYERLLEQYPQNAIALNNLAWLYFEQNDDRATELARRAFELVPENAAIADTYGWILFKSGDLQASIPILEKAHQLAPDSQEIALHLAEAYRETGRNAEAKAILEKYSTSEPG